MNILRSTDEIVCRMYHGFNSDHGSDTSDLGVKELRRLGWSVLESDYYGGVENIVRSLWRTKSKTAIKTASQEVDKIVAAGKKVILMGHSNGATMCAYISQQLQDRGYGDLIVGVVVFNAALKNEYTWAYKVPWIINCFCPDDNVLIWGATTRAAYANFKGWLKDLVGIKKSGNLWGSYGAHANSDDPRVIPVDMSMGNGSSPELEVHGHSEVWTPPIRLQYWMVIVSNKMRTLIRLALEESRKKPESGAEAENGDGDDTDLTRIELPEGSKDPEDTIIYGDPENS